MKDLLILLGLEVLTPALTLSVMVYLLFRWAQVRLPAANEYARDVLTQPTDMRHFPFGEAVIVWSRLLIGDSIFSKQRSALISLLIAAALVFVLVMGLIAPSGPDERSIVRAALSFLGVLLATAPLIWIALPIVVAFLVSHIAFAIFDKLTSSLARPISLTAASLCYLSTAIAGITVFVLGALVYATLFFGFDELVDTFVNIFSTGTLDGCVAGSQKEDCQGELSGFSKILHIPLLVGFVLATMPVWVLLSLASLFILAVLFSKFVSALFGPVDVLVSVTDQELALKEPMAFLAPFAGVASFLLISALLGASHFF